MTKSKSAETKEFTLKYIPIEDVPERQAKWRETFEGIPEGKALVLDTPEFTVRTIRSALHHYQKRKELFKEYSVLLREKKIYVVHPSEASK